jgi:hypothetical protein
VVFFLYSNTVKSIDVANTFVSEILKPVFMPPKNPFLVET